MTDYSADYFDPWGNLEEQEPEGASRGYRSPRRAPEGSAGGAYMFVDEDGDGLDDNTHLRRGDFDRNFNSSGASTGRDKPPFRDGNRDGLDDETGRNASDYRALSASDYARIAGERADRPGGRFVDEDGDGLDDSSGLDAAVFGNATDQAREAGRAQRRGEAGQREAESYDEYVRSGQRQRDLDAGLTPRRDPRQGGGAGGAGGAGGGLSDFDETSADIPIWGWLTGASSRRDAARAQSAEDRNRGIWSDLANFAPTPDDLSVDYGQLAESNLAGATGDAAAMQSERDALQAYEDIYQGGGLTAADRARMELGAHESGRQMRSQREADMSQLRARGMGGSGAAISSMLGAQQGGANTMADRELQMQIAAQERAMQALAGAGSMSGRMRAQGWNEDATRRSALDDMNDKNMQWNARTQDSRRDARQQAYENRERQAAGMTNQYGTDSARRSREGERDDERNRGLLSAAGELLDF